MEVAKYIAVYTAVIAIIWGLGVLFAGAVKDVEIITPTKNVSCAVVSRMFNTSIACWNNT